jgi:hypothetical protein
MARKPPVFLKVGDVIESTLTGISHIVNRCV